jgi:hypothetical protein
MLGVNDWIQLTNAANESVADESNALSQRVQEDEASLSSYNF